MTKIEQAKQAVLVELRKHDKPKPGSFITNCALNTLTVSSIEPISKNVVQQAISQLKKEGLIDYTPSTKVNESHTISLSEQGRNFKPASQAKPIVVKPQPKEKPKEQTMQPLDKSPLDKFVTGYELYDNQGAFICRELDLAAAQAKAQELVVTKMIEIEIKIVTTSTHCRFKPVVHAEYIAA
jgi:hypothetical protein